jgi:hypothetical protein
MKFEAAKDIIDQVKSISKLFAELSQSIEQLEEVEREKYKLALGKTMGEMYLELIHPICMEHPELDFTNGSD